MHTDGREEGITSLVSCEHTVKSTGSMARAASSFSTEPGEVGEARNCQLSVPSLIRTLTLFLSPGTGPARAAVFRAFTKGLGSSVMEEGLPYYLYLVPYVLVPVHVRCLLYGMYRTKARSTVPGTTCGTSCLSAHSTCSLRYLMQTRGCDCVGDVRTALYMLAFSGCSASLLLVNKIIMRFAPLPSLISTVQFVATMIFCQTAMLQGWVPIDKFVWKTTKPYLLYVALFVTTVYCNFKALEHSNVETIIVARSCVPCVVTILEFLCLGRALPTLSSWAALLIMIAGGVGYVITDRAFKLEGFAAYTWTLLYFFVISVEMAYGKHIVGPHIGFESMWG